MKLNEAITIIRNLINEKDVTTEEENQALSMSLVILEEFQYMLERHKVEMCKIN